MTSIRCANGHTHDSVAAVRACSLGGGVAVATKLTPLQEGALAKLEKATVPVQAAAWPTPAQRTAIGNILAKKEYTTEQGNVIANALAVCKVRADVDFVFALVKALPWKSKETTPAPTTPSQPKGANKFGLKDARYAVVFEGKERLFRLRSTKKGFVKVSVKSSDEWYEIKAYAKVQEIIRLIKVDPEAAGLRYGELDRCCRKCGKELSDVDNPYFGQFLGPHCGAEW